MLTAVSLAMRRDGSSGGSIRLSNITEKGIEKEYHTYESLPFLSTWNDFIKSCKIEYWSRLNYIY